MVGKIIFILLAVGLIAGILISQLYLPVDLIKPSGEFPPATEEDTEAQEKIWKAGVEMELKNIWEKING